MVVQKCIVGVEVAVNVLAIRKCIIEKNTHFFSLFFKVIYRNILVIKLAYDNFQNIFSPMKTLGLKHDFVFRVRYAV